MKQSKLKKILAIFLPSASGLVLYVFLAGLIIVLNQFESIKQYLQVGNDINLTHIVAGWASSILTKVLGEGRTDALVVGSFWAVVGLVVYIFLRGLAKLATELDDDLGVRGYVWPKGTNRYKPLEMLGEQFAFRVAASIGFILMVLGPAAAVLRGPVLVSFAGSSQLIRFIIWYIVSILVFHSLVVLARLIVLRARLFG